MYRLYRPHRPKRVEFGGIVLDAVPGSDPFPYDLLMTAPAHGWRQRYDGYDTGAYDNGFFKRVNGLSCIVGVCTDVADRTAGRAYGTRYGEMNETAVVIASSERIAECKYFSSCRLATYTESGLCVTYTRTSGEGDASTVGAPIWRMVHNIRRAASIGLCHGLTRRLLADL